MGLWNKLDNYVKIPTCKCGSAETIVKPMEEDKIHQFLMGLDDAPFSTVRSQILAMERLPSIEKIFNMVQQEENHRSIMVNREARPENMAAFATSHLTRPGYLQGERSMCKHYGKTRHDETTCYELVGYPANWGSHSGQGGRNRGRGGRGGGQANGGRGRGKDVAHHAQALGEDPAKSSSKDYEISSTVTTGFMAKQVQ